MCSALTQRSRLTAGIVFTRRLLLNDGTFETPDKLCVARADRRPTDRESAAASCALYRATNGSSADCLHELGKLLRTIATRRNIASCVPIGVCEATGRVVGCSATAIGDFSIKTLVRVFSDLSCRKSSSSKERELCCSPTLHEAVQRWSRDRPRLSFRANTRDRWSGGRPWAK